jgi:hypothetical protein
MAIVSFAVTTAQEEIIIRRMAATGETNKSEHMRRVYFEGSDADDARLGEMKRQIETLTEAVDRSNKLLRQIASQRSDGLELKLLAGLYMLLHPSVDPGIQATVNRHLDLAGVEAFLTGKGKGR